MFNRATSRHATGNAVSVPARASDSVLGYIKRRAADAQRAGAPAVGGGSLETMRDSVIREHLADCNLALAVFALITAAHDVNRWDLTDEVVNRLCDAARHYVATYDAVAAERGTNP